MNSVKRILPLLGAAAAVLLTGCQSLPITNYRFEGETTVFSSTFNEMPQNVIGINPDMIVDGTLQQHAKRREPVMWQIDETMTRTSRVSFRLKLGDVVDEDYSMATVYMLRRGNPEQYAALQFDDRFGTWFSWKSRNASNSEEITSRRFPEGNWFDVDIILNDDEIILFIDGMRVGSAFLPEYIPDSGAFRVTTYNEITIDDLRIVNFETSLPPEGDSRETAPVDVGIVMPDLPQWRTDAATIIETIEPAGYTADLRVSTGDQALQNEQIRKLVQRGVQVLIVGAVDAGVDSAIAEAERNGVTVIAYRRYIPSSEDFDYYLTFDTQVVGEMQGTMIAEALGLQRVFANDPRYIALFAGDPDADETAAIYDGAMEVLMPHIDRGALRVVGPLPTSSTSFIFDRVTVPDGTADSAEFLMRNLLMTDAADIPLDAVLAPNDTIAGGVITALRTDERYTSPETFPVITGAGGTPEAQERVRTGYQYMTVVQDPARLAALAAELSQRILDGFSRPELDGVRIDDQMHSNEENRVITYLVNPSLVVTPVVRE